MFDVKFGEEVVVWIKLKDGKIVLFEEFKDYCKGKIVCYKILCYVIFIDEYLMMVLGKI